ncbi:MAG: hypothetical protein DBY45_09945, partial [Clostridiales bacterium]
GKDAFLPFAHKSHSFLEPVRTGYAASARDLGLKTKFQTGFLQLNVLLWGSRHYSIGKQINFLYGFTKREKNKPNTKI